MWVKILLFVALAAIAMSAPTSKLLVGPVNIQEEWTEWKAKHNKNYESPEEEAKRFEIFQENVKKITTHNEKFQAGEVTWSQGLNQFADLNQEEFSRTYLGAKMPKSGEAGVF